MSRRKLKENESSSSLVLSEYNGPICSGNKYLLNTSSNIPTTVEKVENPNNKAYFSFKNLFKVNIIFFCANNYWEFYNNKKNLLNSRYSCQKVIRTQWAKITWHIKYGTQFRHFAVRYQARLLLEPCSKQLAWEMIRQLCTELCSLG